MEPIIIENLQIWPEDLGMMNWHNAIGAAKALGEGWRLPTIEEFKNILYPNRDKIPELKEEFYWSSTEYINFFAWTFTFSNGTASNLPKNSTYYVRAVRDFNGDIALDLLLKEF
jgi:hypothetical protein